MKFSVVIDGRRREIEVTEEMMAMIDKRSNEIRTDLIMFGTAFSDKNGNRVDPMDLKFMKDGTIERISGKSKAGKIPESKAESRSKVIADRLDMNHDSDFDDTPIGKPYHDY